MRRAFLVCLLILGSQHVLAMEENGIQNNLNRILRELSGHHCKGIAADMCISTEINQAFLNQLILNLDPQSFVAPSVYQHAELIGKMINFYRSRRNIGNNNASENQLIIDLERALTTYSQTKLLENAIHDFYERSQHRYNAQNLQAETQSTLTLSTNNNQRRQNDSVDYYTYLQSFAMIIAICIAFSF